MINQEQVNKLAEIGMSTDQSLVYSTLLEYGILMGKTLVIKTGLKKGLVYKILEQLLDKDMVERQDRGNLPDYFVAVHPRRLEDIIRHQQQTVDENGLLLESLMTSMVSKYNLNNDKPSVQIFEGIEGIKTVVLDSTRASTEIFTIADNEAMNKYHPEINKANKKMRTQNRTFKKILSVDSDYIRKLAQNDDREWTERRLLKNITAIETVIQIYDNKISYITLDPERAVAVIIEDKALAETQRMLFKLLWQQADSAYE